jgi:reverse gyrase
MDKRQELAEKLQWIADYNQGKREKPPFTTEEMIEARTYQVELAKERMKKMMEELEEKGNDKR